MQVREVIASAASSRSDDTFPIL